MTPDWGSIIEVEYNEDMIGQEIDLDHDGEIEDQTNRDDLPDTQTFKKFKDKIYSSSNFLPFFMSTSMVLEFPILENHYISLTFESKDRPPQA